MTVDFNRYEAIRHKFVKDYGLRPVSEETDLAKNSVVATFHDSVDAQTFLRHLHTLTPLQYEELEMPQE